MIESWNFQHLFEIEFFGTSQNFNSFSSFRQLLFSYFLSVVWLSWNFVRFHQIFNLEKQKVLSLKKFWGAILNIKTKNICLLTQFSVKVLIIGSLISFIRILLDGTMIIAINEYQQTLLKIWSYLAIPGLFCRLLFNIALKISIHKSPDSNTANDPNWWFNITWFIIVLDLCLRYFGLVNVNIALNETIRMDNENAATMELQPLLDPKDTHGDT